MSSRQATAKLNHVTIKKVYLHTNSSLRLPAVCVSPSGLYSIYKKTKSAAIVQKTN